MKIAKKKESIRKKKTKFVKKAEISLQILSKERKNAMTICLI